MRDEVASNAVLVIGASGFIGRAVVQTLSSTGARKIVATSRSNRHAEAATPDNVRWVVCDVMDPASIRSACSGIDCVVNCYRDDVNEAASAQAISNVLDACEACGVKRLIYFSSAAVYGGAAGMVDEWTPFSSPINWYGRAKAQAERACSAKASANFRVAILRPTLVYGPGGEEWFSGFMQSIQSGSLGQLGADGDGVANLIYIDDLARMCSKLTHSEIPEFSIAIANGSERVTFNDYFGEIRRALGSDCARPPPTKRLLQKIASKYRRPARGALKLSRLVARPVLGRSKTLRQLFSDAEKALQHRPEDGAKHSFSNKTYYSPLQAQALGLEADTSLRDGVAKCMEWERARG